MTDQYDDDMIYLGRDYARHRKKAKKPPIKKADHKHQYETCIGRLDQDFRGTWYMKIKRCSVCNKINIEEFFMTESIPDEPAARMLQDPDDIKKVYPDLEIVGVHYSGNQLVLDEE